MLWRITGPGPADSMTDAPLDRRRAATSPPSPTGRSTSSSSAAGSSARGAALDAATRGLRVGLVERDDIAVGTSSRSSRLIHGGLRYLEQYRFGLVREALTERSRILHLAPHLVTIQPLLFPLFGWPVATRVFYQAGMTLYDVLGARQRRRLASSPLRRRGPRPRAGECAGSASAAACCSTTGWRTTRGTRSRSPGPRGRTGRRS